MSNQFRAQGGAQRDGRFRRGGSSSQNRSRRTSNGSRNHQRRPQSNQKSQLTLLNEEYNPPFQLLSEWKPSEFYKIKLPHPFFPDEKETVQFPILESTGTIADRAMHYQEVLDLQDSVNFDGDNGPNLYYTYTRCLKGQALIDWKAIAGLRATAAQRTPEHFAADIDEFIKTNESRDNEDLLQDQLNYMNHIKKPRNTKPTDFKSQLIKLNNRVPLIPGAEENDKLDEARLKAIFMAAMPPQWKKDYKKLGRRMRDENLDDLAQTFDLFFDEPTKNKPSPNGNGNGNGNPNSHQRDRPSGGRIRDNDICPIHGHHKWKDCIFNKHGPNYRPPARGNANGSGFGGGNRPNGDQHHNGQARDGRAQDSQGNNGANHPPEDNESRSNDSSDGNPYADDFKETGVKDEPVPQIVVEAKQESVENSFLFEQCLLDSGGSRSLIARSRIPNGAEVKPLSKSYNAMSAAGTTEYKESVTFSRIRFPEFNDHIWAEDIDFIVFDDDGHSAYDLVIGRDIIRILGFEFSFEDLTVNWCNKKLPFVQRHSKPSNSTTPAIESHEDVSESFLLESDYNTTTTGSEVATSQEHLSREEQAQLGAVLEEFNAMFNRTLGVFHGAMADLKLINPNVTPIHTRPFSVPDKYRVLLKKELDKLTALGVLEPVISSPWAFPTFLIPKKDDTARFVSDFRLLNKVLVDEQFPLPLIKEVLTRRCGFNYVSVLDLTSQFYHFLLTKFASKLCTITTPFGLYRYKRLPMGVKNSPSFAQSIMQNLFRNHPHVECFIDDIAIFTDGNFSKHIEAIRNVMIILDKAGFSIKPKKCHWAVQQVEYLGHIITTDGIKPQPKKIDAILRLQAPSTPKQLRSFIGMVNYYRDFIRKRSHRLAPLTAQTKQKKKIVWNSACQKAFEEIKAALAQDAMLAFPNPNYPFVIEPDASDYQLGSIVLQNQTISKIKHIIKLFSDSPSTVPPGFKAIAYFSRKLSSAQRNYTTLEKELLSIVETLLEYRSFLYGRRVLVFSDHRNLTFNNMKSQRALRWRLIAEEFNITIIHRAGASNVAADAISRLPMMDTEVPSLVRQAEERFNESYLFYPVQHHMNSLYPLSFKNLEEHQAADAALQECVIAKPKKFKKLDIGRRTLIHSRPHDKSIAWKIVIPSTLVTPSVEWFHRTLNHPGTGRMIGTITRHFWFPRMRAIIEDFVKHCDTCQRIKGPFPKLGKLPAKQVESNPWEEVQVDLVGPWKFKYPPKWQISMFAVTAIDPFTGLCEALRIKNKTCAHVATRFFQMWLCRYPRPLRCIHDNGSEFVAQEFQDTLKHYGIQDVPTTAKNPQANSVVERMHHTVASMLRSMILEAQQKKHNLLSQDIDDFIDTALASSVYAINATVHSVTNESPGAFVYQRDMMLPIQSIANWEIIRLKKSNNIHRNFMRENNRRKHFDWQPGMEVLVESPEGEKLSAKSTGPFRIERIHTNGTVTIKIKPQTFQRLNIRGSNHTSGATTMTTTTSAINIKNYNYKYIYLFLHYGLLHLLQLLHLLYLQNKENLQIYSC